MHPRVAVVSLCLFLVAATARGGKKGFPKMPTEPTVVTFGVALQYSGHLRELCDDNGKFGTIEYTVRHCRETVQKADPSAWCDVFMHTWDTLHPKTPTWHNHGRTYRDLGLNSSAACVERLRKDLGPVTVKVDDQAESTDLDYARDRATWFCPHDLTRDCPPRSDTGVTYAGLRAATRAAVEASKLRRVAEAAFEAKAVAVTADGDGNGAHTGGRRAYRVAVRLRPDTFKTAGRAKIGGLSNEAIDHFGWLAAASAAASGGAAMAGAAPSASLLVGLNRTLFGCHSQLKPGMRNNDHCFWGATDVMDAALEGWRAMTDEAISANRCWREACNPEGAYAKAKQPEDERQMREYLLAANCKALGREPDPGESPLRHALSLRRIGAQGLISAIGQQGRMGDGHAGR